MTAAKKKICVCSGKCATVRCYCRSKGLSCNYKCCCKECTNNIPHSEESDSECEDDIVDERIGNKYHEILVVHLFKETIYEYLSW